jgi:hypothetical protein
MISQSNWVVEMMDITSGHVWGIGRDVYIGWMDGSQVPCALIPYLNPLDTLLIGFGSP